MKKNNRFFQISRAKYPLNLYWKISEFLIMKIRIFSFSIQLHVCIFTNYNYLTDYLFKQRHKIIAFQFLGKSCHTSWIQEKKATCACFESFYLTCMYLCVSVCVCVCMISLLLRSKGIHVWENMNFIENSICLSLKSQWN